jgi:hypothetical protein
VDSSFYQQTSWSQSADYTNVAISAWLFGTTGPGGYVPSAGTAYLTSTLPGVSLQHALVFPDPAGLATHMLLFSGLYLQAGTYYLTLASSDPFGGGWSDDLNGGPGSSTTLDNGVTLGTHGFASPANLNVSNPPASTFNPVSPQPFFDVTGDPVPEPGSVALVGVAAAVLFARRRWRVRS